MLESQISLRALLQLIFRLSYSVSGDKGMRRCYNTDQYMHNTFIHESTDLFHSTMTPQEDIWTNKHVHKVGGQLLPSNDKIQYNKEENDK